jgi:hypothetical protein
MPLIIKPKTHINVAVRDPSSGEIKVESVTLEAFKKMTGAHDIKAWTEETAYDDKEALPSLDTVRYPPKDKAHLAAMVAKMEATIPHLSVIYLNAIHGYGVRAEKDFKAGELVVFYSGKYSCQMLDKNAPDQYVSNVQNSARIDAKEYRGIGSMIPSAHTAVFDDFSDYNDCKLEDYEFNAEVKREQLLIQNMTGMGNFSVEGIPYQILTNGEPIKKGTLLGNNYGYSHFVANKMPPAFCYQNGKLVDEKLYTCKRTRLFFEEKELLRATQFYTREGLTTEAKRCVEQKKCLSIDYEDEKFSILIEPAPLLQLLAEQKHSPHVYIPERMYKKAVLSAKKDSPNSPLKLVFNGGQPLVGQQLPEPPFIIEDVATWKNDSGAQVEFGKTVSVAMGTSFHHGGKFYEIYKASVLKIIQNYDQGIFSQILNPEEYSVIDSANAEFPANNQQPALSSFILHAEEAAVSLTTSNSLALFSGVLMPDTVSAPNSLLNTIQPLVTPVLLPTTTPAPALPPLSKQTLFATSTNSQAKDSKIPQPLDNKGSQVHGNGTSSSMPQAH